MDNNTSGQTSENLAQQTVTVGYGAYLYFDLTQNNVNNYLSAVSTVLYNDRMRLENGCFQSWIFNRDIE